MDACRTLRTPANGFFLFISLILMVFVASCLFPEEFKAKVVIDKAGSYSFVYDGILTYVPAKAAEVQQGRLTAREDAELKKLEQEFLKDQNFKKVKYAGHGRFKVVYQREGMLGRPFYFISRDAAIVSIKRTSDRNVEIKGLKLTRKDMKQLESLKMGVNGELRVTTNAKVKEHNAMSEPYFFGENGSYIWQIKSVRDPVPYMKVELG